MRGDFNNTTGNERRKIMARQPVFETEEQILVTDPSEQDEAAKIIEMLESIAGEKGEKFKAYLHRASEKNRAVAAAFLQRYPAETSLDVIYDDAQGKYKGGNFVIVVREGNKIFRKASLAAED